MTGHYPEPSPTTVRPVAYHGCVCTCHVFAGVKHITACCSPYTVGETTFLTPEPESQPGMDAMHWLPEPEPAPPRPGATAGWEATVTLTLRLQDGSPSRTLTATSDVRGIAGGAREPETDRSWPSVALDDAIEAIVTGEPDLFDRPLPEPEQWQPMVGAWTEPWHPADGSFWTDRDGERWQYDETTGTLTRRQLGMSPIRQPREYVQRFYGPMRSERRRT